MKRLILIAALALLLLPAAAQADETKPLQDYRPWKAAMLVWTDNYAWNVWPTPDWSQFDLDFITLETPMGFSYWVNTWGAPARQFAQLITAITGEIPNGQLDRPLKRLLTPYLGISPEDEQPARSMMKRAPR